MIAGFHSMAGVSVLVTGGSGLVGSYVSAELHKIGIDVTAVDKNQSISAAMCKWHNWMMDLQSSESLKVIRSLQETECIVHCAALLPNNLVDEALVAKANRILDKGLIKLCRESGTKMIFISTTSVYDTETGAIVNENTPVKPKGAYARAKVESEMELLDSLSNAAVLRICAPYGAGQRSKTVLRLFIGNALTNADLSYYGNGNRTQDFTYAGDIARAVVNCIKTPNVAGVFNITGGAPITMKELAALVLKCVPNSTSTVMNLDVADPQENYRALFNIQKASDLLGWVPETTLEDGISEWIQWIRNHENCSNF